MESERQQVTNNLSPQQQLNARAKSIGVQIEVFSGWNVTASDGNVYIVKTTAQLYALISNLESGAKNDN